MDEALPLVAERVANRYSTFIILIKLLIKRWYLRQRPFGISLSGPHTFHVSWSQERYNMPQLVFTVTARLWALGRNDDIELAYVPIHVEIYWSYKDLRHVVVTEVPLRTFLRAAGSETLIWGH